MIATIPHDITRAPYWIVREYVSAYNRAAVGGDDDPDGTARRALGKLSIGEKGGPGSGNHSHLGRPGIVGGSGPGGGPKVDSEGKYIPGSVGAASGVDTSKWNKGNTYAQWAMKKIDTIETLVAQGQWDVLAKKAYTNPKGLSNKFVNAVLQAQANIGKNHGQQLQKLSEPMKPASPKQPEVASGSKWEKVGPQLGSQPGGTYMFEGKKYYVKTPNDPDFARNEVLAMRLYEAAGVPVAKMNLVEIDGKLAVASEWMETSGVPWHGAGPKKDASQDFAAHAWLANWDALGAPGDMNNIRQRDSDGKLVVVDAGGTMNYRAMETSGKKPFPGNKVDEWDTLRDPAKAPAAAQVFGGMTPAQLQMSAAKLKNVTGDQIQELVLKYGPGSQTDKGALAMALMDRRNIIIKKAEDDFVKWAGEQVQQKPGASATQILAEAKPAPLSKAPMSYPPKPQLSKTFQKHYGNKVDELWDAAAKGLDAVMAVKTNPNAGSPMPKKCHEYKMQLLAAMGVKGQPNPDHVQPAKSGTGGKPKMNPADFPAKPVFATKKESIKSMNEAQVTEAWKHAEAGDLEALQQMKLHASPKLQAWHAELMVNVSYQLHPPPPPKKLSESYTKIVEQVSGKLSKDGMQKVGFWNVIGDAGGVPQGLPSSKGVSAEKWEEGRAVYDKLPITQQSAIKSYTANGYVSINRNLRSGNKLSPKTMAAAKAVMDSGIEIPDGSMLYRGHSWSKHDNINPGAVVCDRGLLSTTTSELHGGFTNRAVWKITIGPGVKGLPARKFSSHPGENEVILPPNQRFIVTKIENEMKYGSKATIIHAVALPTDPHQCCPP